ncbi:right-handed parallel beta-helix repeat-containing protein [Aestuariibacter sp. AA17]|uniref:Right-handed parallel beta-helix repeat-containing protein n=1 Tax=Fluctibacter corallii TaxID=2984329 RepID=A0ABT3A8I3_9ALTE|nr:right-handed parallel beta-helix repeat-containing protein [Aestuariibacter sp. AA17]MCV2884908.1 right-handed parallel beta-helix repeat-containing protein [Aestuariibacter sp. AA17]
MKYLILLLSISVAFHIKATDFTVSTLKAESTENFSPSLPSLEGFTEQAVRTKLLAYPSKGKTSVERMVGNFEALKFYRLGLITEWSKRQGEFPKAIFVRDGKVTLDEIHAAAPEELSITKDGKYIARVPIIVGHDGILVVDNHDTLLMSQESGAFLINAGVMFILNSEVSGWSETNGTYSEYSGDKKVFRPFITSMGGTRTYMVNSEFHSLGYESQKSYGISLITHTDSTLERAPAIGEGIDPSGPPTGWLLNNKFVEIYFGFFSYEAEDVAIVGNHYIDNIVYGIDPHDRSERLIIAKNIVEGAREKHGIIISREVNNSFIFANTVFNNNRSGIMLDRSCEHNIVANNTIYNNGGDGITFYESSHNVTWKNKIYENKEHGIRVRNSIDVSLVDEIVMANKGSAVYFHTRDLSDHTHRDLALDPYTMLVSGSVTGGLFAYNESGAIHGEDISTVELANLTLQKNGGTKGSLGFTGDFALHQTEIVRQLYAKQAAGVKLERSETE